MKDYREHLHESIRSVAWTLNDLTPSVRRIANGEDATPEDVQFAQSLDSLVDALLRLVDPDEYEDDPDALLREEDAEAGGDATLTDRRPWVEDRFGNTDLYREGDLATYPKED